jgi:NADH-quinone oxidoreductase subunit A
MQIKNYIPILVFIGVAIGFSALLLLLSRIRGKNNPYDSKNDPYECGFLPFDESESNSRKPFNIKFYLVSILFIIFDLEIAFLFPWAVAFKDLSVFGFWSMMVFLLVLTVGFLYEWRKGALEWN